MPLVNPLVIAPFASAEFHESVSRICLANANVEACLPAPLHPAAITVIAMYNRFTVHRSCATISVNYCGRRGKCIRVPPAFSDLSDPSYSRKMTGIVVQIKSFVAQERFYIVTLFAIGTNLRITGF